MLVTLATVYVTKTGRVIPDGSSFQVSLVNKGECLVTTSSGQPEWIPFHFFDEVTHLKAMSDMGKDKPSPQEVADFAEWLFPSHAFTRLGKLKLD